MINFHDVQLVNYPKRFRTKYILYRKKNFLDNYATVLNNCEDKVNDPNDISDQGRSAPLLGHRSRNCYQMLPNWRQWGGDPPVLCHGTAVASHREVRVTIGLDLLCSGLIMPFYITYVEHENSTETLWKRCHTTLLRNGR